jgi:amidophosphoribosyltransferase
MTDIINHECGIALIRLLKPLEHYQVKYGTWRYGIQKLYLLMEKQRNRGQDGTGVASVKLNMPPGSKYIHSERSADPQSLDKVFKKLYSSIAKVNKKNPDSVDDPHFAKKNIPFAGELLLGHLRYGTYGKNKIEYVHPVMRQNNWKTRNLVMAGNFNLTNVDELFQHLIALGQFPKDFSDTVTILENVGHFLDVENQKEFDKYKKQGYDNRIISGKIAQNIDVANIIRESSKKWDGGYAISGILGHGDAFVTRDPWGIRPAYYYYDDEIAVVASERPVIQTAFNLKYDDVQEVTPGHALIIKNDGRVEMKQVRDNQEKRSCSFERIYFSRGSDYDIYRERKKLGELLIPQIVKSVKDDLDNTVFSYIPNTAETAFYGMVFGIEKYMQNQEKERIMALGKDFTPEDIDQIVSRKPRIEKVAIKDVKLRTFIAQDKGRSDLVGHVYDITYGTLKRNQDNLVIIDDSIVRGTTLKHSIIRILDRLDPKKIVVVSSSPQIRYPDCYGIDMAKLGDFIAFQAAIQLLKDRGMERVINEVYKKSKEQENAPKEEVVNYVKDIYAPFSDEEISAKIAEMLRPKNVKAELDIIYQSVDNLHKACPNHRGDWYFTGDFPTPGGNKVVNRAFINYIEGKNIRAY